MGSKFIVQRSTVVDVRGGDFARGDFGKLDALKIGTSTDEGQAVLVVVYALGFDLPVVEEHR